MVEPVGPNRGNESSPDGITIFHFSWSRALCWDATYVNTFAESSISDAANEVGYTAAKGENAKRANTIYVCIYV